VSEEPYDEQPRSAKKKWRVALLLLIGLPVGGYYGFAAWKHAATHVSTDNAYVQADMAQITPRVHGTVIDDELATIKWLQETRALLSATPAA
jgi:multidrug resistance efflux pump